MGKSISAVLLTCDNGGYIIAASTEIAIKDGCDQAWGSRHQARIFAQIPSSCDTIGVDYYGRVRCPRIREFPKAADLMSEYST
jgi:hypothetical protein